MSRKPRKDAARKDGAVSVPDLAHWCAALEDEWNLWVQVCWSPALPSQREKNCGTVLVKARRWYEGQHTERVLAQETVARGGRETIEEVALRLLSRIYVGSQSELWEEERASLGA